MKLNIYSGDNPIKAFIIIMNVIFIIYLIAETFDNMAIHIYEINESTKGIKIVQFLLVLFAFGVIFLVYKYIIGSFEFWKGQ